MIFKASFHAKFLFIELPWGSRFPSKLIKCLDMNEDDDRLWTTAGGNSFTSDKGYQSTGQSSIEKAFAAQGFVDHKYSPSSAAESISIRALLLAKRAKGEDFT